MAFSFSPRFWPVRWTLPAIAVVGLCCENHLVLAQSVKPVGGAGGAGAPGGLGIPPAIRDSSVRDSSIRDASATQGKRPAASNSRPGVPNPAGASTAPSVAPVRGEIAGSELLRDPLARFLLQLRLGQITPQEAWQNGQIKAGDILEILSKAKRVASGGRNEDLQRDLAGVLVQNAPQLVQDHRTLPLWVRVALARYYSSIGDMRTVEISEDLLKQLDRKAKGSDPWPQLWGVILLAQYHEKTQQWQKAGETWERALGYQSNVGWWQAGVRVDAARAYLEVGGDDFEKKAHQLYFQAAHSSSSTDATGAILEGFGRALQRNPKQAEIQLMQIEKQTTAPNARLATQFLLARARYKAQDWKGFLMRARQVLQKYEQIEDRSRRQGFSLLALDIEEAQKWAKLWIENSIVAENNDLHLVFDGPLLQAVERRVFLNTPTSTQLQVTVEGGKERVQARLEESPWAPGLEEIRHQQIVVITITPGVSQVQALIRVQCLQQLSKPLELALKVSTSKPAISFQ